MTQAGFVETTRDAYTARAAEYSELFRDPLADQPLDRALIDTFADLVKATGAGPIADLGCGPGHYTAYLHTRGVTAFGIDLSPGMIEQARQEHPGLRFEVGSMFSLDLADAGVGGVFSHYSIIHTPPERVHELFDEFARVLAPGGHLLLSFSATDDPSQPAEPYDHVVSLAYRWSTDMISAMLRERDVIETGRLIFPGDQDPKRGFPRVFLLAGKTG
ncbi:class I SAM-dependent methyltransferase [Nonomuraea sp. 3-1Str]|uniref:class I SAM-dependent methyltransferase n=1 Tax=Nonomuraea sp. 3-1Str TaxID=2929801 RepID=UPI002858D1E1|nr:class I SAM-dependent methyltransferase [Nonomuraea sp. 3-1Str]MDR8407979.1 class I SAM-dependent methyltransferase [Nonomuraea sp. 3-1Str]